MFLKYDDIHMVVPTGDNVVVTISVPGNIAWLFGRGKRKTNNEEVISTLCLSAHFSEVYKDEGKLNTTHLVLDQEQTDRAIELFDLYNDACHALAVITKYDLTVSPKMYFKLSQTFESSRKELIEDFNIIPSSITEYGKFHEFGVEDAV